MFFLELKSGVTFRTYECQFLTHEYDIHLISLANVSKGQEMILCLFFRNKIILYIVQNKRQDNCIWFFFFRKFLFFLYTLNIKRSLVFNESAFYQWIKIFIRELEYFFYVDFEWQMREYLLMFIHIFFMWEDSIGFIIPRKTQVRDRFFF